MQNSINNNSSSNILENMNMTSSANQKNEIISPEVNENSMEFQNLLNNLKSLGEKQIVNPIGENVMSTNKSNIAQQDAIKPNVLVDNMNTLSLDNNVDKTTEQESQSNKNLMPNLKNKITNKEELIENLTNIKNQLVEKSQKNQTENISKEQRKSIFPQINQEVKKVTQDQNINKDSGFFLNNEKLNKRFMSNSEFKSIISDENKLKSMQPEKNIDNQFVKLSLLSNKKSNELPINKVLENNFQQKIGENKHLLKNSILNPKQSQKELLLQKVLGKNLQKSSNINQELTNKVSASVIDNKNGKSISNTILNNQSNINQSKINQNFLQNNLDSNAEVDSNIINNKPLNSNVNNDTLSQLVQRTNQIDSMSINQPGVGQGQNVINMDRINTANTMEVINKISDYIMQNKEAANPRVDVRVSHQGLGIFDITIEKLAKTDNLNIQISTFTDEGSSFFNNNRAGLLSTLSSSGLNVNSLNLESKSSGEQASNQSNDSQGGTSGQNKEGFNREEKRENRNETWKKYYEGELS